MTRPVRWPRARLLTVQLVDPYGQPLTDEVGMRLPEFSLVDQLRATAAERWKDTGTDEFAVPFTPPGGDARAPYRFVLRA